MHCEPASQIIEKLGGVTAVSEAAGVDLSRVVRWRLPKDRGGTGGLIPFKHVTKLLAFAEANGVALSFADFEPQPEDHPA
jgi:hypothetical protein